MSEGIQFGDVEHAEPEQALRPDQDAHFVTVPVGEPQSDQLAIFVDLDVMRDMEAHAISNTRVELGGVMLGKQLLDDQGQPFVVITECLRAEHYEATKGSFKFTHQTWSQITRQRAQFHPDLEMVGWYHTHPGWSVFLSGMDLFICNHFFNRPLDVALVIDPCEQDRGWFQWTESDPPQTMRTAGFTMMTSRYRRDELEFFARLYNKEPDMNVDPRYSSSPIGSTSVQLVDQRRSVLEIAVIGMLAMQFLLLLIVAWFLVSPTANSQEVAELQAKIESLESQREATIREEAQQQVLASVVGSLSGDEKLLDRYTQLKENERLMRSNLEGQLALTEQLKAERKLALAKSQELQSESKKYQDQLARARNKLRDSETNAKRLAAALEGEELPAASWPWLEMVLTGLGALVLGTVGTYLWTANSSTVEEIPRDNGEQQIASFSADSEPGNQRGFEQDQADGKPMVFTDESNSTPSE